MVILESSTGRWYGTAGEERKGRLQLQIASERIEAKGELTRRETGGPRGKFFLSRKL